MHRDFSELDFVQSTTSNRRATVSCGACLRGHRTELTDLLGEFGQGLLLLPSHLGASEERAQGTDEVVQGESFLPGGRDSDAGPAFEAADDSLCWRPAGG